MILLKAWFMNYKTNEEQTVLPTLNFFLENLFTMWNFLNFFITQILREINFWESRSAKSAILRL